MIKQILLRWISARPLYSADKKTCGGTVKKINIVGPDGTLRAVLSSSAGFNFGQRAGNGPFRIAGLIFYNEEGQETGLVYRGNVTIPEGLRCHGDACMRPK